MPSRDEALITDLAAAWGDVRGQRVLDLGYGQGWFSRQLAQRGAHVVGVDFSAGQIANARSVKKPRTGLAPWPGNVSKPPEPVGHAQPLRPLTARGDGPRLATTDLVPIELNLPVGDVEIVGVDARLVADGQDLPEVAMGLLVRARPHDGLIVEADHVPGAGIGLGGGDRH